LESLHLLIEMVDKGELVRVGERRGTRYFLPEERRIDSRAPGSDSRS
jgi:hypothetical protein